jgi:hypothetical protein
LRFLAFIRSIDVLFSHKFVWIMLEMSTKAVKIQLDMFLGMGSITCNEGGLKARYWKSPDAVFKIGVLVSGSWVGHFLLDSCFQSSVHLTFPRRVVLGSLRSMLGRQQEELEAGTYKLSGIQMVSI